MPEAPVLLVTRRVAPERVGALRELHERMPIEVAIFSGRDHHFTDGVQDPGVPHRHVRQARVGPLAARGRWRAVIAGTAGRVALPSAYAGAKLGRHPFVLWSAMWHEPRTAAMLVAGPGLRRIARDADAVAVYGEHVAAHLHSIGAQRTHVAPQAVDPETWIDPPAEPRPEDDPFRVLYVGRDAPGKGVVALLVAWRRSRVSDAHGAELVMLGPPPAADGGLPGARAIGPVDAAEVRSWLDRADLLIVPSQPTRLFLEPWGLVCNEAMHRGVPVLATTAVGAAAGGLVRDRRNGRVVDSGSAPALARALGDLARDPETTAAYGRNAREDVRAFTHAAWADGMARAVRTAEEHHRAR